ncbi:class I adenylate-forming enzyme family protein [Sphingosinithalassobacter portus]|uniref:class I adenylate-forming enzyme family protein n=1 Tax=Stakelama portus TaxID=2676234 RepID=UPI000D6DED81|nr:AMP-binding protein [Sphingosinithalassobacter portus]
MPMTIDHAFRWWAGEHPDRVMLACAGRRVTYAQLDAWVGRVASHFCDLGFVPGDRVAIVAENGMEWVVAMLAAIRAGGISAGLSTRMVASELDWMIADYTPRIIVSDPTNIAKVNPGGANLVTTETIMGLLTGDSRDIKLPQADDDIAILVTTSGSTARPKGVMFTNRAICEHNMWQVVSDPLTGPYRRLLVAPMSTSAGTIPFLHTLLSGGTAYLEAKFDAAEALRLIVEEKVNFITGAPIFFQRMADLPEFADADVSHLDIAHTGGATVVQPLLEKWEKKGVILRQMFGQTESGGTGVINSRAHALTRPDKCGGTMMFTDIGIVDDAGNFLAAGETGEIVLRGPGMMAGYWNNPQATAEALRDGWLYTGDIGVMDELGLVKMIDRKKDIIISGGLNISAAEVERVILELGVEEVAVIAARDERFGEVPMAVVHGNVPDTAALVAYCCENLSDFKVPRYLIHSDTPLPRLASGKISKPALRQSHGGDKPLPPRIR